MSGACSVPVGDAESECEKEEVAESEPAEEKPVGEVGQTAGPE